MIKIKIVSYPEVSLLLFFQVGVAAIHRRALLSAGPQPGNAPPAVGVSSWLRYSLAGRATLLFLRPAERHQWCGSGQIGEAGFRPGGLRFRGWGGPYTEWGATTTAGRASPTMTCLLRHFYLYDIIVCLRLPSQQGALLRPTEDLSCQSLTVVRIIQWLGKLNALATAVTISSRVGQGLCLDRC